MARRITIMINADIEHKIRNLQASLIRKTKQNWSFSSVLNIVTKTGINHTNAKKIIKEREKSS